MPILRRCDITISPTNFFRCHSFRITKLTNRNVDRVAKPLRQEYQLSAKTTLKNWIRTLLIIFVLYYSWIVKLKYLKRTSFNREITWIIIKVLSIMWVTFVIDFNGEDDTHINVHAVNDVTLWSHSDSRYYE